MFIPVEIPPLEQRNAEVMIDGKRFRIPMAAMRARHFTFLLPEPGKLKLTHHADLGLPKLARPQDADSPAGPSVSTEFGIFALEPEPAELHEDRTPPAGPYPPAPPAGGASVHTETPAEPYQAPEPSRPA